MVTTTALHTSAGLARNEKRGGESKREGRRGALLAIHTTDGEVVLSNRV